MGLNKSSMFPNGIIKLNTGVIDFDTHVIRAVMVKKSFANTTFTTTTRDSYDFLNDIPTADRSKNSAFVVLATRDAVNDTTNDNVDFGGGTTSMSFTVVTNGTSCRGLVFFKSSSATETACPIICYNHFTANVTADGGTVTVTLNANGIFKASYD